MKRKLLIFSIIAFLLCFIVATLFYFLMKDAEPIIEEETPAYDTSIILDKIDFLKFKSYDEIKKYADDYPIHIQESDDKSIFSIGELYIEEKPVKLIYELNNDGSIKRFDGSCSIDISEKTPLGLQKTIGLFDTIMSQYFMVERFEHDFYDKNGAPIDSDSEESYKLMFDGNATYGLSVIDDNSTYWYIKASVVDGKQINFEFFRCYDLSVYNDDSPNLDLRVKDNTGEK